MGLIHTLIKLQFKLEFEPSQNKFCFWCIDLQLVIQTLDDFSFIVRMVYLLPETGSVHLAAGNQFLLRPNVSHSPIPGITLLL